mmetsp:Transcript_81/g.121  ORF Transcript_81/g.121 Transcript_81/m.121 type:complete len:356 (-) Transcript_81:89-1156(-)
MRNMRSTVVLTPATLLLLLVTALQAVLLVVDSLSLEPFLHHRCHNSHHHSDRRRAFIASTLIASSSSALFQPTLTFAAEEATTSSRNGKPFAPLEALLPATRLKLWVDQVYLLSQDLSFQNNNEQQKEQQLSITLQQLNNQLSDPPKLFQGETTIPNSKNKQQRIINNAAITGQFTNNISPANKDQYQKNRSGLNNPSNKLMAMWNQADVERQWGMLQYAESKREEGNEMRAAFNFYTRQLSFADEYVLTASKEKRKEMIRNDALPSVTTVVASDLDRRDLYRNEFLTVIDDVVAEVAYQVRLMEKKEKMEEEVDVTDIVSLMNVAHEACENWFSLIPGQDVEEAVAAVMAENAK